MARRTATLAERVASIERDIANAAKAYPADLSLSNCARGLRKIVRELDATALTTRKRVDTIAEQLGDGMPHGEGDVVPTEIAALRMIAYSLSNAREGTV